MLKLILSALLLGILLSFLIGPVFFVTIETSLLIGSRAAIVLNLGVILADITCIFLSYFSSIEIIRYLDSHPSIFKLCGIIILLYGFFITIYNNNNVDKETQNLPKNYLKLFFKGYFLNIINIGVIIFWLSVVLLVSTIYNNKFNFILYIMISLFTSFCIDLCKILLGRKIYYKFNNKILFNKIKKIVGILLIIFGIFLFIKSFFHTSLLELKYKHLFF